MSKQCCHWKHIAKAHALAFLVSLVSCAFEIPVDTDGRTEDADVLYRVYLPAMPLDTVHMEMEINRWQYGDTIRFLLPPVYADNPLPEQAGENVHNVVIRDTAGALVMSATRDDFQVAGYECRMVITAAEPPLRVEYDVTFGYSPRDGLPLPHIGATEGYLQGTYLYALPCGPDTSIVGIWRTPWTLKVEYELGNGVELYGDPTHGVRFRNAYELLFSTSALGGDSIGGSDAADIPFRIVNLQDTLYDQTTLHDSLEGHFSVIVKDVAGLFGDLGDWPLTVILGVNKGGGLEGMHAFSILNPMADDTQGVWNAVAAHELIHCWVGVRVGDIEDPWWKEGTTTYLGLLVAARHSMCSRGYLEGILLKDLKDSADVANHALSSGSVRRLLFSPGQDDCIDLVYMKGAQVSMLMDTEIRLGSDGAMSLDTIVADLCREFDGRAFGRNDYLSRIRAHTRTQAVDTLFERYVEEAGAIDTARLRSAYEQLDSLGAFGDLPRSTASVLVQGALPKRGMVGLPKGKW